MIAHRVSSTLAALAGLAVLGAASAASAQDAQLFAVLLGGNEVGPTGQAAAGDPDGSGAAAVSLVAADQLCFSILVNRLDPPALAHIHQGVAGTNGPIVVNLAPPVAGDFGHVSGCVPGIDPNLLESIRRTPAEFYVNVHTGAFPAGAVRGQLF
jgi:CHRD domain